VRGLQEPCKDMQHVDDYGKVLSKGKDKGSYY
jgi:hypothetical protein